MAPIWRICVLLILVAALGDAHDVVAGPGGPGGPGGSGPSDTLFQVTGDIEGAGGDGDGAGGDALTLEEVQGDLEILPLPATTTKAPLVQALGDLQAKVPQRYALGGPFGGAGGGPQKPQEGHSPLDRGLGGPNEVIDEDAGTPAGPVPGGPGGIGGPGGPGVTPHPVERPPDAPQGPGSPGSPGGPGGPGGPCLPGGVVIRTLGDKVSVSDYDPSLYFEENGGPIILEGELDCDVDVNCCWNNAKPPSDKLEFRTAEGSVDSKLFQGNFNTNKKPTGKFLIAATPCAEEESYEADFVSCTIACTETPVTVHFIEANLGSLPQYVEKHWTTPELKLSVCARASFFSQPDQNPLLHCVDVPTSESPGPSSVTLPPGIMFDVVIVAKNFIDPLGDVVILDNIRVDYELCPQEPEIAATPAPPPTTTEAGPDSETECLFIECDFEAKDTCSYSSTPVAALFESTHAVDLYNEFAVKGPRFGNYVTGIRDAAEGQLYAVAYMKPGEAAGLDVDIPDPGLGPDRLIRFLHYEATTGLFLMACCGEGGADCVWQSEQDALPDRDFRIWGTKTIGCPEGTTKIRFVCNSREDSHASWTQNSQGACAVDNIQLIDGTGVSEAQWDDPNLPLLCLFRERQKAQAKARARARAQSLVRTRARNIARSRARFLARKTGRQ